MNNPVIIAADRRRVPGPWRGIKKDNREGLDCAAVAAAGGDENNADVTAAARPAQ